MADQRTEGRKRVVIENVSPEIDCGRFAVKRVVGDQIRVEADVFADGHDTLACRLLCRHEKESDWCGSAMAPLENDRWRAELPLAGVGRYFYTVEGWIDPFRTWRADLLKRIRAGQNASVDLLIGASLIEEAANRAAGADADRLREWARILRENPAGGGREEIALDEDLFQAMERYPDRRLASRYPKDLPLIVDREKAAFSSWYEMFPRSCSPEPGRHGNLRDCGDRLSYVAGMGFDVVYLPPIHPIGRSFRKGRNNSVVAEPGDPGSPWAIGAAEGGHKAIHPDLGTFEDFEWLVGKAANLGIEIALDIAFQCALDHPWVREHPGWFRKRPDGSIQYAENPPKKYEDIYPLDFETPDWRALWQELKSVFLFWIGKGVRIFRVDNPHTKAFPFWEWVIAEIKGEHPDVLFLAEAFTRPKVMYELAKIGFSQSYTYFAWRNTKLELASYFRELTRGEVREYFRPNIWPNTPDILTEFLQVGGPPAFAIRFLLAATLGATYGIYGPSFELLENTPREPGSEEYLNSEKYEIRHWDLTSPLSLSELIGRVNRIRRDNPALHNNQSLCFHETDNPSLICYSKNSTDLSNVVIVVVNLDPAHTQSGWVQLDLGSLGLDPNLPFQAHDLIGEARYLWHGPRNYIELNPKSMPAHIMRVRKRVRTERDFDYYL